MDYGKYMYQLNKRAKEAKKRQHVTVVKEVKMRPKIEPHDYDFKMRHAREFLAEGDKVKCTVIFRGRELAHKELGAKSDGAGRRGPGGCGEGRGRDQVGGEEHGDGPGSEAGLEEQGEREGRQMPKIKTHKGAAKRFKRTAPASSRGARPTAATSSSGRAHARSGTSARPGTCPSRQDAHRADSLPK